MVCSVQQSHAAAFLAGVVSESEQEDDQGPPIMVSDEEDEDKGVFDQFDKMEKISLLDGEDDLGSDTCPCSCHSGHTELRKN